MNTQTKATHCDNVRRAISRLILHHPFYAAMTLMTPVIPTKDVPTAATDGHKIYYNPEFMDSLTPEGVMFVMSHEVEHIVRLHCLRVGTRDARKWNIAADHGINLDLMAAGLKGPEDENGKFMGLADSQYEGMAAEKVYNLLPEQEQQGGGGSGQGGDGDQESSGGGDGDGDQDQSDDGGTPNIFDGDVLHPKGEDGNPADAAEQASMDREVRGRVMQAASQVKAASGIGSIPQHLRGLIAELGESRVDWKHELREFVTARCATDYDWSRLNRRVRHRGLRMPSLHSEQVGGIAVILDTSGSCHGYIPDFLGELLAVASDAKPEKIHVLFVDTRVQNYVEASPDNFEADMGEFMTHPPHGGGTDLRVGFEWIEANAGDVEAVLCLTDMMTPWPDSFELADRTLFVDTFGNSDAPFGRKVVLSD